MQHQPISCNRHVGFKDLEAYLRKEDYLTGYSKSEQAQIRKNLGIETSIEDYLKTCIYVTHSEITQLIADKALKPRNTYVITDFQTIYERNGQIWGQDLHPSYIYNIIVNALTTTQLDNYVKIISKDFEKSLLWDVRYNVKSEIGKGEITYLQDELGNSAPFDFKSIQYERSKSNTDKVSENSEVVRTFNDTATNVTLNGTGNIFLSTAENVSVLGNNNLFGCPVKNTIIHNVDTSTFNHPLFVSIINKDVYPTESGSPIVSYLDSETLTYQNYEIDNIYS